MSEETKIIAYKGFDSDMKCRGYAFEVGKTYSHEGEVEPCASGFHACTNPWDVLSYYDITSRFALVELGGETKTHTGDSKIASAEITIKAELKLPYFISSCINYLPEFCKNNSEIASGDGSQQAASGYGSQQELTGRSSIAVQAGIGGRIKLGENCTGSLARWVESEQRYRISVAYEGENVKRDIWYQLDDNGNFVECK
jgi:hypothetical protein